MLKHIWKDPVWASVISTGIAAGLGSLSAYFLGYWPAIQDSLLAAWNFLLTKSAISNWIIVLMSIPTVLIGLFVIAVIWSHWFGPNEGEPNWQTYTMDNFFDLRWRWNYAGGSIERLTTFCPHCDYQVFPINVSAYNAVDRIEFKCDSCHSHLGTFDESVWDLKSKVERFIQQKIRTGRFQG